MEDPYDLDFRGASQTRKYRGRTPTPSRKSPCSSQPDTAVVFRGLLAVERTQMPYLPEGKGARKNYLTLALRKENKSVVSPELPMANLETAKCRHEQPARATGHRV